MEDGMKSYGMGYDRLINDRMSQEETREYGMKYDGMREGDIGKRAGMSDGRN